LVADVILTFASARPAIPVVGFPLRISLALSFSIKGNKPHIKMPISCRYTFPIPYRVVRETNANREDLYFLGEYV
jgi:hypothetical protein